MEIEKVKEYLKNALTDKRYKHSISVAETAKKLAIQYEVDLEKAYLAGLLHDIAKEKSVEEMIRFIELEGIVVRDKATNAVLHAPASVYLCKTIMHIEDEDILNACRYHTTGRAGMSLLEKIIFLADYIEPLRVFPGVEKVREIANRNLDLALVQALGATINKLKVTNKLIDQDSLEALDWFMKGYDNETK